MRRPRPLAEFIIVLLVLALFFVTAASIVIHFAGEDSIAVIPVVAIIYIAPFAIMMLSPQRQRLIRYNRALRGQCQSCGYDIRASLGRCPECGSEIPEKDGNKSN
jgi:hypothetical protein